jgi:hypothetical protein
LLENKDHVSILNKALYGLKQAPKAWYSRLDKYLQQQSFKRGVVDINIYIKEDKVFKRGVENINIYIKADNENMLIIVVYVDDIIFGSNNDRMRQKFAE